MPTRNTERNSDDRAVQFEKNLRGSQDSNFSTFLLAPYISDQEDKVVIGWSIQSPMNRDVGLRQASKSSIYQANTSIQENMDKLHSYEQTILKRDLLNFYGLWDSSIMDIERISTNISHRGFVVSGIPGLRIILNTSSNSKAQTRHHGPFAGMHLCHEQGLLVESIQVRKKRALMVSINSKNHMYRPRGARSSLQVAGSLAGMPLDFVRSSHTSSSTSELPQPKRHRIVNVPNSDISNVVEKSKFILHDVYVQF